MLVLLLACALPLPPEVAAALPAPGPPEAWIGDGPITLETAVSARWTVPLHGLLDLDAARAIDPTIADGKTPIVIPVTALRHPDRGVFLVDSGIDQDLADGGHGPVRGLLRGFFGALEPVESLSRIAERQGAPVAALLLTHNHIDHVLGLQDLPPGTPVITGAGELRTRSIENALTRRTYRAAYEGVTLHVLDPNTAVRHEPFAHTWDLTGDGALWAIAVPGHTPGSLAFLARTIDGPVLLVGDTSHTRWGWDHGVPPGSYTEDPEANAASLGRLRELVAAHPEIRVIVGHELTD